MCFFVIRLNKKKGKILYLGTGKKKKRKSWTSDSVVHKLDVKEFDSNGVDKLLCTAV